VRVFGVLPSANAEKAEGAAQGFFEFRGGARNSTTDRFHEFLRSKNSQGAKRQGCRTKSLARFGFAEFRFAKLRFGGRILSVAARRAATQKAKALPDRQGFRPRKG
jgi:hypothetical protein